MYHLWRHLVRPESLLGIEDLADSEVNAECFQQTGDKVEGDLAQLEDYTRKEAGEAIEHMQKSVGMELTRLIDLVLGLNDPDRPGWRGWWLGPAMLALGLVLGVIGNIVSVCLTT